MNWREEASEVAREKAAQFYQGGRLVRRPGLSDLKVRAFSALPCAAVAL